MKNTIKLLSFVILTSVATIFSTGTIQQESADDACLAFRTSLTFVSLNKDDGFFVDNRIIHNFSKANSEVAVTLDNLITFWENEYSTPEFSRLLTQKDKIYMLEDPMPSLKERLTENFVGLFKLINKTVRLENDVKIKHSIIKCLADSSEQFLIRVCNLLTTSLERQKNVLTDFKEEPNLLFGLIYELKKTELNHWVLFTNEYVEKMKRSKKTGHPFAMSFRLKNARNGY